MSFNKLNPVMVDIATADVAEIRIDPVRNHRSLYARRAFGADEVIVEFTSRADSYDSQLPYYTDRRRPAH